MKQFLIRMELIDSVVFSRRNATEGGHEVLDHVPGSSLWGAMCQALYASGSTHADAVAHRASIWFGNGRPTIDGPSWPVPLCWHADKTRPERPPVAAGKLQLGNISNALHDNLSLLGQPRALGAGYVDARGHWIVPLRRFHLRTSLPDPLDDSALPQLFGYESLMRGQRLGARVVLHDDKLEGELRRVFHDKTLRLGRSRTAEYGRVRCTVQDAPKKRLSDKEADPCTLVVWLISDACLLNDWGQPTLVANPDLLGILGAKLDAVRSFVRHRQASFFNSHRQAHGPVHHLLAAGSVLTFVREGQPFTENERERVADGMGTLRERGFGEVWVDPTMLGKNWPGFQPSKVADRPKKTQDAKPPEATLMSWAKARLDESKANNEAENWAAISLRGLAERLLRARRYNGVLDDSLCGPSPAQWGQFGQICRDALDFEPAKNALFTASSALLKRPAGAQPDWTLRFSTDSKGKPEGLNEWIVEAFEAFLREEPKERKKAWAWPKAQRALCLWAQQAREADLRHFQALAAHLPRSAADQQEML